VRVVHLLRKPLSEPSVAANVLAHGCGALNIDGVRIATDEIGPRRPDTRREDRENWRIAGGSTGSGAASLEGRWPTNLILSHRPECECIGNKKIKVNWGQPSERRTSETGYEGGWKKHDRPVGYGDEGGQETVEDWRCQTNCPVADLDDQSGHRRPRPSKAVLEGGEKMFHKGSRSSEWSIGGLETRGYFDPGGASRFFKQIGGRDRCGSSTS
jgi:site-specific DNA-methyltransferase (adenine-specific)